jgi:hypothetical protein
MNPSQVLSHVVSAIEQPTAFRANERTGPDVLGIDMALQQSFGCEKAITTISGSLVRGLAAAENL